MADGATPREIAAQLNLSLFRLRKAGKLCHVHAARRTEFTWREFDQYLFAAASKSNTAANK